MLGDDQTAAGWRFAPPATVGSSANMHPVEWTVLVRTGTSRHRHWCSDSIVAVARTSQYVIAWTRSLFQFDIMPHHVCHKIYCSTCVTRGKIEGNCSVTCKISQRQVTTVTVLGIGVMHNVLLRHAPYQICSFHAMHSQYTVLLYSAQKWDHCASDLRDKM